MIYNSTVQQYFEVTPNNPSGCTVGTSTCVYTVLYTGQIDLAPINPATGQPVTGGYFLIHEACCRNGGANGIDNIQSPGSAAMAFYSLFLLMDMKTIVLYLLITQFLLFVLVILQRF